MSLERTRAEDLHLSALLDGIHSGRVVLPDFQRDFDWSTQDVKSLLATVLSGWPIGSLLLMKGPPTFFQVRAIEGAPQPTQDVAYVVLDGQQRLTALYQSLYGRGPTRYALNLETLLAQQDIDSLDEGIVTYRQDYWIKHFGTEVDQFRAGVLPLAALRSATDFFMWRDAALVGATNRDYESQRLTNLYRGFLSGLHQYEVQSVVVESSVAPSAIARIFERVNRMGMPLGTFDLMVARSYAPNFNLRSAWEGARSDYPLLQAFFKEDGLPVLNSLALRLKKDVRARAVLDLKGTAVRDNWNSAVSSMDAAVRFVSGRLGVWNYDWLPYKNVLIVLAALAAERSIDDLMLERWYWSVVFGRRYDVASNTRAVSDYEALQVGEDNLPKGIVIVQDVMLEATKKQQGALHRAFLTAVAASKPRDPITGAPLAGPISERRAELIAVPVSLFPRQVVGANGEQQLHLRTLGQVLADPSSAGDILKQRLNVSAMRSQLVDHWTDRPQTLEEAQEILVARFTALVETIRQKSGRPVRVVVNSDDEDEFESV